MFGYCLLTTSLIVCLNENLKHVSFIKFLSYMLHIFFRKVSYISCIQCHFMIKIFWISEGRSCKEYLHSMMLSSNPYKNIVMKQILL